MLEHTHYISILNMYISFADIVCTYFMHMYYEHILCTEYIYIPYEKVLYAVEQPRRKINVLVFHNYISSQDDLAKRHNC